MSVQEPQKLGDYMVPTVVATTTIFVGSKGKERKGMEGRRQ
jgi:hypothetical protein